MHALTTQQITRADAYSRALAQPTPWYLTADALRAIVALRANPPALVTHRQVYPLSVDEWTEHEGETADALTAVWAANPDYIADDRIVMHAALGATPYPLFNDTLALIERVAGEIEAALALRVAA